MHYIRFLKTPVVQVHNGSVSLKAVITITTDLGETFYLDDISLAASLRSPEPDGDLYLRRSIAWTGGMRSLAITMDITHSEVEWPASLHVGLRSKRAHLSDHFETLNKANEMPAIISVWSEPLHPTKGSFHTSKRVERHFMPLSNRSLHIFEDTGESIARHLWDGSLALTAYVDQVIAMQADSSMPLLERALLSATFRRLNVLELGCGCGVVGIALAQTVTDCSVVLTDLPEVDELVERNIEAAFPAISSSIEFTPLDWEAELPLSVQSRSFDIIIAAECIYNTDSIPPLVNTICALLARSPKAIVLVSTKVRHESEAMFHDLAQKSGLVEASKATLPLPGQPGHGYGDSATHVDVYVFRGKSGRSSRSPEDVEKRLELPA